MLLCSFLTQRREARHEPGPRVARAARAACAATQRAREAVASPAPWTLPPLAPVWIRLFFGFGDYRGGDVAEMMLVVVGLDL